jgi:SAM-dependent MidA family methyltransferase
MARVVAVDVVDRPDGLDDRIEWLRSPGGADLPDEVHDIEDALVVAHEWLDAVPCTIARADADGAIHEVLVDPASGDESVGAPIGSDDDAWIRAHWPEPAPGETVEVGRQRDDAWAGLIRRVRSGLLVAVDYGHTRPERPREGSLTAYVGGKQVVPVPDGSCDITAHVAMDSLEHDELGTQREVLRGLGVLGRTPPVTEAVTDPLAYLAGLERAGAEAQLIDPSGFGAFWWAVKRVDVP